MTEAKDPGTKDFPVLVHFRRKDPKTGKSVHYDPKGDNFEETGEGWPGAKAHFTGVPGSDEVQELFAGADGTHGPLIAEPDEAKFAEDDPATKADDSSKAIARGTTPKSATETKGN